MNKVGSFRKIVMAGPTLHTRCIHLSKMGGANPNTWYVCNCLQHMYMYQSHCIFFPRLLTLAQSDIWLGLKVLGHALRMRTKYITSCTRPPVWRHLQVNRSSERGLCLLIAWWRTFLLPCCRQPTARSRTKVQNNTKCLHTSHSSTPGV